MTPTYPQLSRQNSKKRQPENPDSGLDVKIQPLDPEMLNQAWQALEVVSNASIFQSWAWISLWLEKSDHPRYTVEVLDGARRVGLGVFTYAVVERSIGGKKKLLALHENGRRDEDQIAVEYNGLLCERGFERDVQQAVVKELSLVNGFLGSDIAWQEVRWPGCANDPRTGDDGVELLSRVYRKQQAPFVDLSALPSDEGAYLKTRSTNLRYQLRRSIKLLGVQNDHALVRASSKADVERVWEQLKQLHQKTWTKRGKPGSFANRFFTDFHDTFVLQNVEDGTIDLLELTAFGETIGVLYNFVHRGVVYAYQSGFVNYSDNRLKPGLVSHALAIMYYKKRGLKKYTFLAGNDRYKQSLATDTDTLYWVALQRPDFLMRLESALRKIKSFFNFGGQE